MREEIRARIMLVAVFGMSLAAMLGVVLAMAIRPPPMDPRAPFPAGDVIAVSLPEPA